MYFICDRIGVAFALASLALNSAYVEINVFWKEKMTHVIFLKSRQIMNVNNALFWF